MQKKTIYIFILFFIFIFMEKHKPHEVDEKASNCNNNHFKVVLL
jgi:hypothetical protein